MQLRRQSRERFASDDFTVGRKIVTVNNIPAFICPKCGEKYFDGPTVVKIEKDLKKYGVPRSFGQKVSI